MEADESTSMEANEISNQAISTLQPTWTRELINNYAQDQQLQQLIQQFYQGDLNQVQY
jgi:hypothetical protein